MLFKRTLSLRSTFCFAALAVLPAVATAQYQQPNTGVTSYPWRASATGSGNTLRQQPGIPTPPAINADGSSFRLLPATHRMQDPVPAEQQQSGAQASLSDTQKLTDDVPNPPTGANQSPLEQNRPLSVNSNAIDEDYSSYCNQSDGRCNLGEVRRIFGTSPNGLSIGGFNQSGYHNRNSNNFNNRREEANIHQLWGYIDQSADCNAGRMFGFRIDGLYGIDAQDIQAIGNSPTGAPAGWDNGWDNGSFGFALPQAYIEYDNSDTNIKLGKFLSPIGFESIPSVENFFYSRTYARYYTEPFSHTGLLAEREIRPGVTGIAGVTLGWNTGFDQTDNGFNILSGIRMKPTDRVSLGLTASLGDTGYRGSGVLQTATAEVRMTDKVTWGLQGDYLNLGPNDEYGLTNYLFYCHNKCFSVGTRLEWWKSDQFGNGTQSTWDSTLGANWRPRANVVIRPEVRVDWGANVVNVGDPILGIDAIFLF